MSPFVLSSLLGLAAACVCALALVLVHRAAGLTRAHAPLFAAFAGGVVVTLALVQLIPESLALHGNAPWLVLAGFAAGFILNAFIGASSKNTSTINRWSALTPVIAIAIHSALDGTVYAVTASMDALIALSTALGLIIHELPETLICFILLQRAGFSDRISTILAFLAAGATTLGAALITAPFTLQLDEQMLGRVFAVVAGLLLHVGASHLLNEARETSPLRGSSAVFAGAGVAAVMAMGHNATHDHSSHSHTHHHHSAAHPDFRPPDNEGDH